MIFFDIAVGQTFDLYPSGLTVSNIQATLPDGSAVTDVFLGETDAAVTVVASGANTVGADTGSFMTWSWAGVSGSIDGL